MKAINCPNCGNKLNEGTLFCGVCGQKVIQATEKIKVEKNSCPKCNKELEKDEKFCSGCGTPVSKIATEKIQSPSQPKLKSSRKMKKGGILHTLGKVALWFFVLLIVATTILYFIGDDPKSKTAEDKQTDKSIERHSKEDRALTSVKVRQANPVLSNTSSFKILANSKVQEFSYSDNIKVTTPPDFTFKNKSLAISNATVDKAIMVEDSEPLMMIDLTLEDGKQPSKPVKISYTYNKTDLNPNFTAEEQLAAFRWDEKNGGWITLPKRIDEKKHEVSILTDHFSIFVIVAVAGIVNAAKGYVDFKDWVKLNGLYVTPEKNFRIKYSKQAIYKDGYINDRRWKIKHPSSKIKYSSEHPLFIQDIGGFLEQSLKKYNNSFQNPTKNYYDAFKGNYHTMITVMMDSYLQGITWPIDMSDPFYEKLEERLYIPASKCSEVKKAKTIVAHELFHRVQAQYYGRKGMFSPFNQWWLEATAEYAAYEIAWKPTLKGIDKSCGVNYLTFPINSRGDKRALGNGWAKRDYEYLTSNFIKYLVDKEGFDFKKMIESVASDNLIPINSLPNYSYKNHKLSLDDAYRNFANWMTFSSNSPLESFPLASFDAGKNQDNLIATKRSKLIQGSGKEITYTFDLPDHYSSKLWAIKITKDPLDKKNVKKPISIKVKSKTPGITADVFVLAQGERYLTPPTPIKSIITKDKPVMIFAQPNDLIFVSATQGVMKEGSVEVIVSDVGISLEIDPSELANVKARETNYFTIRAKNIPKEIEQVKFEWDYNDGSKQGVENYVGVYEGEAQIKISHSYGESDKEEIHPLKVVLKDDKTAISLATAEALITVPLEGTTVFITERHITGPPGATFDMEALASPENSYKFVWQVEGMAEAYTQEGEKSGIAPIIDKIGEYMATVKLYDMDGNYLATDVASISVEEDVNELEPINGMERIDDEKKLERKMGRWVQYDIKAINGSKEYSNKCHKIGTCVCNAGSFQFSKTIICSKPPVSESISGTYTVPPKIITPGDKNIFEVTFKRVNTSSGWASMSAQLYNTSEGFEINERGDIIKGSREWNETIVHTNHSRYTSYNEFVFPDDLNKKGVLRIDAGFTMGNFFYSAKNYYLYKWQE